MKLSFDSNSSPKYPNGYWYAITDDGGWDGVGVTPLDALACLIEGIEQQGRIEIR